MFGKHLIDRGLLTEAQVLRVLEEQSTTRTNVGRLAFEMEYLTLDQIVAVIAAQENEKGKLRFCAQAVELGFLTSDQRMELLEIQREARAPLGQVIVTMGLLDPEVVERELEAYHALIGT